VALLYWLNADIQRNLFVIGRVFRGVVPIVIEEPIVTDGSIYLAASIIASSRNSPRFMVVFFAMAVHSGLDKGSMPGVFWNSSQPP
jgi:hypothetical protein